MKRARNDNADGEDGAQGPDEPGKRMTRKPTVALMCYDMPFYELQLNVLHYSASERDGNETTDERGPKHYVLSGSG